MRVLKLVCILAFAFSVSSAFAARTTGPMSSGNGDECKYSSKGDRQNNRASDAALVAATLNLPKPPKTTDGDGNTVIR